MVGSERRGVWWVGACSTTHDFIVAAGIGRKVPALLWSAQVMVTGQHRVTIPVGICGFGAEQVV